MWFVCLPRCDAHERCCVLASHAYLSSYEFLHDIHSLFVFHRPCGTNVRLRFNHFESIPINDEDWPRTFLNDYICSIYPQQLVQVMKLRWMVVSRSLSRWIIHFSFPDHLRIINISLVDKLYPINHDKSRYYCESLIDRKKI